MHPARSDRTNAAPASRDRIRTLAARSQRRGFTLVELLVVIVIIGILAGLTVGGVQVARQAARRAVIKTEIGQLAMALERYKNEVGEYPPDFTCLNEDNDPTVDTPAETAAKAVLTRHLHKRFPRYTGDWDDFTLAISNAYGWGNGTATDPTDDFVDFSQLDSASALAFWLGGMPESNTSRKPAGFSADPSNPCRAGLPRTESYYDFNADEGRFVYIELPDPTAAPSASNQGTLRCWYAPSMPAGIPPAPYVYFRAQRARSNNAHTYVFTERDPTTGSYIAAVRTWTDLNNLAMGRALPYRDGAPPDPNSPWRNASTYQILSAGLDGNYGVRPVDPPAPAAPPLPSYDYPVTKTGAHFAPDGGDYDNMANFADGTLEHELQ